MRPIISIAAGLVFIIVSMAFIPASTQDVSSNYNDTIHFPGETHFANVRQFTFGGDNAEAYFSPDGNYLIFLQGG